VVVADQDGHVKEIVEKQRSGRGIANTGVYIMSRNFFNYYEEVKAMATGKEVYLTDAPKALSAHEVRFRLMMLSKWHGINTPDDLLRAHDILV
jgi:NDP-sugar pyrophosphorylase family protein